MISYNFVNGNPASIPIGDAYFSLLNDTDSIYESILSDINDFNKRAQAVYTESSIMGDNSYELFIEAESPNIVEKIGKGVKAMVAKAVEFIKSIVEAIKNLGFKNKSDMAKVQALVNKHPDLKDEIIGSFKKGELNVKDVSTFTELEKAYEDIVKLAQTAENPNSLKAKWNKAVKKFEDNSKTITNVGKAVTTVVAAAGAILAFRKIFNEANASAKTLQECHIRGTNMAMEALGEDKIKDMGSRELVLTATRYVNNQASKCSNEYKTLATKIHDSVVKFLDKVDPESKKKAAGLISDSKKFAADAAKKAEEVNKLRQTTDEARQAIRDARRATNNAVNAAKYAGKKAQSVNHMTKKFGQVTGTEIAKRRSHKKK